jgi:hypothetical protein
MTFYEELVQSCPPARGSAFAEKQGAHTARLAEARRLSALMRTRRPFCFVRMGDMEASYLLAQQCNRLGEIELAVGPTSGTRAYGNSGIGTQHAERLRRAYEAADYVDFHEANWPNEHLIPRLNLKRPPDLFRNPTKEASLVFLTWTEKEFREYCQNRRVGFAGAEARLLELLSATVEFKKAAVDYWPETSQMFYHQVRNEGPYLDANLDLVKEDLRQFVHQNRIDTLFLSLSAWAKILGYELSRELGICCFDFGSMLRALTYSGCDGNRMARATHAPFLFRVPFDVYMNALERAMPNLAPAELLAKAHAQLLQELMKKEIGWTVVSWQFELAPENLAAFRTGFKEYRRRYNKLFNSSRAAKKERADFLHFCGVHRLTGEGRRFLSVFRVKDFVRRCLGFPRIIFTKPGFKIDCDGVKGLKRRTDTTTAR